MLAYLRRMYMPLKNYMDLDQDFLMGYWSQDKDILGVTHFGDLIPEVVWLGELYEKRLQELIHLRIEYKLSKYRGESPSQEVKEQILTIKEELRSQVEKQIQERLAALRHYLRSPTRDPHLSLTEIYRTKPGRVSDWAEPMFRLIRNIKSRKSFPPDV